MNNSADFEDGSFQLPEIIDIRQPIWLELLADDELDFEQRAEVIAQIEQHDQWKRCAMLYINSQATGRMLMDGLVVRPDVSSNTDKKIPTTRQRTESMGSAENNDSDRSAKKNQLMNKDASVGRDHRRFPWGLALASCFILTAFPFGYGYVRASQDRELLRHSNDQLANAITQAAQRLDDDSPANSDAMSESISDAQRQAIFEPNTLRLFSVEEIDGELFVFIPYQEAMEHNKTMTIPRVIRDDNGMRHVETFQEQKATRTIRNVPWPVLLTDRVRLHDLQENKVAFSELTERLRATGDRIAILPAGLDVPPSWIHLLPNETVVLRTE